MDFVEIVEELYKNYPDKIVVDISEYENDNHQTYKNLYESFYESYKKMEEDNFTFLTQRQDLEKELVEATAEIERLRNQISILSNSLCPAIESIKESCTQSILVTNVIADPQNVKEEIFDVSKFMSTISERPGVYGKYRPSWFTPLRVGLSKENVQKKNIDATSDVFIEKIKFWKHLKTKSRLRLEQACDEYEQKRKEDILELINSDCSNEEKYLKYFLMTPGLGKEYLKTLNGASELNINAKLLISLLEQPLDHFNKNIIEAYVSKLHKGTEYNLKQELAEELVRGDWYIVADLNGVTEKFQLVPVSVLTDVVNKVNAISEFLDFSADDELSANPAESSSNQFEEQNNESFATDQETIGNKDMPSFIQFDDSMI